MARGRLIKTESAHLKARKSIKAASYYVALAADYEQRAAAHERKASSGTTLLSRFGAKLAEQKIGRLDEKASIVWDWDRNKDGKLDKGEFRLQVKGLGVSDADVKEIDALFGSFDKDSSGFLELSELKVGFKRAMLAAAEMEAQSRDVLERVGQLRRLADEAKAVAELTLDLESEQRSLDEMQSKGGSTLEARLGATISKKNMHVADMVAMDRNDDGGVDKREFRAFLEAEGIHGVSGEELDELYAALDVDGSGALDRVELNESLKKLRTSLAPAKKGGLREACTRPARGLSLAPCVRPANVLPSSPFCAAAGWLPMPCNTSTRAAAGILVACRACSLFCCVRVPLLIERASSPTDVLSGAAAAHAVNELADAAELVLQLERIVQTKQSRFEKLMAEDVPVQGEAEGKGEALPTVAEAPEQSATVLS